MRGNRGKLKHLEVNNRKLRNHEYKGKNYPLGNQYPDGVDFDKYGFPIFDPYVIKHPKTGDPLEVVIKMGGNANDRLKAEKALHEMGLNPAFHPDKKNTWLDNQLGGTWHHLQDGKTMQLVIYDVHENAKHTGGEAMVRHLRNIGRD